MFIFLFIYLFVFFLVLRLWMLFKFMGLNGIVWGVRRDEEDVEVDFCGILNFSDFYIRDV